MGVKFKMQFYNVQNIECTLNFIVDDTLYSGNPITIYGGARPFVLTEYNQDNDIFRPVRGQQATIEVLASANGIKLEDFIIEDDDRSMKVRFDFGAFTGYWYGVLSQEDMQEEWIAQNHILTLRADDGFGALRDVPLVDDTGALLDGLYTPFALLQYAVGDSVQSFFNCHVFSNLFHTSMTTANTDTGLDQCKIDSRTFQASEIDYEDSYTVLEKINRAWNQTIFQYRGQWYIVRMEDQFVNQATNIRGFQNNATIGNRGAIFTRYMANVGINEKIKPISPEMLKTLNKPSKDTKIYYKHEFPDQLLCNEDFQKGTIVTDTTSVKTYTITDWTLYKTSRESPVAATNVFDRKVEYSILNEVTDNYARIVKSLSYESWASSCEIIVQAGDIIDFDIQYKTTGNFGGDIKMAQVQLKRIESLQYRYGLNNEGKWVLCTTDWDSANNPYLSLQLDVSTLANNWVNVQVRSEPVPYDSILKVLLVCPVIGLGDEAHYKDLNLGIISKIDGRYDVNIAGTYDQYTIAKSVVKNFEEQTYLDNTLNLYRKGAIFQSDGATLTDDNWFRRRYNSERFGFKREKAIAHWWINKKYRVRLECNFFGLIWERSGTDFPIGLINTIKFVDDAPNKTFVIVNIRDIDFLNCTWSANLLEVWDEDTDVDVVPDTTDVHTSGPYYE